MGLPYTSVTITSYNANPPSDDGAQTAANRVTWATQKTKLTDPLKTAIESINTNIGTAFGKVVGGASITTTAISYGIGASDQGGLVKATASGITITTPDATAVGSPFSVGVLNNSTGDITLDGSGTQTIDGALSITIPAGAGVFIFTDGTNWFTGGQNFFRTQVRPQGYLTPTSATPVIAADVIAATSLFYTPDEGNLLPIPDGTKFTVREFAELTLALAAQHVASNIYDVFAFDNAGTVTIGTGPAWTTATAGSGARGTGAGTTELQRLKGLWTNKVSMTARDGATTYTVAANCGVYLGSIFIDGTNGQITCHRAFGQSRKWGIWNAYNRKSIILQMGDATATWVYSTNTIRQSRATAGNTLAIFSGLPEPLVKITAIQVVDTDQGSGTSSATIGVGLNSTTAYSGKVGKNLVQNGHFFSDLVARHVAPPFIGISNVNFLESGNGTGITTVQGGNDDMLMTAEWLG